MKYAHHSYRIVPGQNVYFMKLRQYISFLEKQRDEYHNFVQQKSKKKIIGDLEYATPYSVVKYFRQLKEDCFLVSFHAEGFVPILTDDHVNRC